MNKTSLETIAREERNKYAREWRKNNKDKTKQHQKAYWERQALKKIKEQGE